MNKKERAIEWQKLNPDKVRAIRRRYYLKNADKLKAYAKWYRDANRDKARESRERSISGMPFYNHWIGSRRKARAKGVDHSISKDQMAEMWKRDGASEMSYPSLDRTDLRGPFSVENCFFCELKEHSSTRRRAGLRSMKF